MANKNLRETFLNPPKGGNGQTGITTTSSMARNKRIEDVDYPKSGSGWPGSGVPSGGGKGIADRRIDAERAAMPREERWRADMDRIDAEVARPKSGPEAQTSLRDTFEKGELTARTGALRSTCVGAQEFRNFARGIPTQPLDPLSPISTFELESAQDGTSKVLDGSMNASQAPAVTSPRPTLTPAKPDGRADGKETPSMGVPNVGNSTPYAPERVVRRPL